MALQHLRSSTANKRPLPAGMSDGQLAINTNNTSPGLFFKDSAGALVKVGPVHVGTTAPNASPASGGETGNTVGEQWLDTTGGTYVFKVWDGSAWRSESGTFVDVNGDTMTGALGIIAGTAAAPGLFFSGDTNTGIYSPGADQLAISTNSTGRLFVDSSGRVGVGTNSPSQLLSLSSGAGPRLSITDTRASVDMQVLADNVAGYAGTTTNYPLIFVTNNSERLRITSAGLVGIGTSSVTGNLHVKGDDGINIGRADGGNQWRLIPTNGGTGSSNLRLYENVSNTEVLNITTGGRVGIGTTSPATSLHLLGANTAARGQLSVAGNAADPRITLYRDSAFIGAMYGDTTNGVSIAAETGYSITFNPGGASEKARFDSSGRLLVGTSSARSGFGNSSATPQVQIEGTSYDGSTLSITRNVNSGGNPEFIFGKSRGGSVGSYTVVADGDTLGAIRFDGADGTDFATGAYISAQVDGTPGTNDMPGRLVFSTTADGASSPTEQLRITNDGVHCYNQPAPPANKTGSSTLTVADLKTGIITHSGGSGTLTLPTGTLTEGGFSNVYTNMAFEWSLIHTGAGTATVSAGTDHTVVGNGAVSSDASGRFVTRRTATNTFVSYRLS